MGLQEMSESEKSGGNAEPLLKGGIIRDRAATDTKGIGKKNVSFSDDLQVNQYYDENRRRSSSQLGRHWIRNIKSNKMSLLKSSTNSLSRQSEGVFSSYQFHVIVIICVILCLLCITGELLVMSIELTNQVDSLRYAQTHPVTRTTTQAPGPFNAPPVLSANSLAGIKKLLFNLTGPGVAEPSSPVTATGQADVSVVQPQRALQVLARIFRYMGLTIVSVFVTEYLIKSISYPRIFIKSKIEIVEIIVTVISFVMDIMLIERRHVIHAIATILVVFRLWRFVKVINKIEELVYEIHEDYETEIEERERRINQLDDLNKRLRKTEEA